MLYEDCRSILAERDQQSLDEVDIRILHGEAVNDEENEESESETEESYEEEVAPPRRLRPDAGLALAMRHCDDALESYEPPVRTTGLDEAKTLTEEPPAATSNDSLGSRLKTARPRSKRSLAGDRLALFFGEPFEIAPNMADTE
jgi:hypothetical protein